MSMLFRSTLPQIIIFLVCMHVAAYHVPNWEINNIGVKSHKPPYATFRGPGKGPAIFIMESMMDHLARSLNLDVEEVKRMNLYTMGQVCLSVLPRVNNNP